MRVLLCASTFPIHEHDGTPRFVLDLATALAQHCAVTVLAPHAPGAARRERFGPVVVERFVYALPHRAQRLAYGAGMPDNLRRSWAARAQVAPFLAAEARAVRRLARHERIDVVNAHWIVPQGLCAAWARGRAPRFRHVVTLHGSDAHLLHALPRGVGRRLATWVAARSDGFIAVSDHVRRQLDGVLGRPAGAVVQPMGAWLSRFRDAAPAAPDRFGAAFAQGFLLCVARLVPLKGVDVLLHALARVRRHHPGLGLVVIGDGPEAGELARLARELAQADAVRFAGRLPHAEVAAALRACRAVVVPSTPGADGREEGMPTVVAEALAAGARLVASAVGGIPDVVAPGRSGWLARPGDAEDLAARIREALEAPADAERERSAARAARALDWPQVARATLDVFERALARPAAPAG